MLSIGSPKTTPITAVGIVPTMIRGINFPSSVLKSNWAKADSMCLMSFLKKNRMTINVPMCRVTSNSMGTCKRKKCSASFRCPVLDIGSHSVKP